MALIEYGFLGRDKDGKRKAFTISHSCCFGSLGTALLRLNDERNKYIPITDVEWIPDKVIVSCQETAEDFRYWFKRLRKDFPTYRVNGVDHPAPTARYYDVNSRQPGHLNDGKGNGPLRKDPKRSYVILSFPEGTTNNVLYIGLKFYMKNLMNPHPVTTSGSVEKHTMAGLFKMAEQKLAQAGVPNANMRLIVTAMSSSHGGHTMGYAWPIPSSRCYKDALTAFLTTGYECTDFVDDNTFFHKGDGFGIYVPKNSPKDLSSWDAVANGRPLLRDVFGWEDAINRIKEALV